MIRLLRDSGRVRGTEEVLEALNGSKIGGLTKKRVGTILKAELGLRFKRTRAVN